MDYDKTSKETMPYNHYRALFEKLDPHEAASRCNVLYNGQTQRFSVCLLGEEIQISYPDGLFYDAGGNEFLSYPTAILLLRYLTQMGYAQSSGKLITYRDMPSGDVYYRQFEGRCIKRLAYGFASKLDEFKNGMEAMGAVQIDMGDAACKFEFISGFSVVFILWQADDEFPPSAQILFSDNFPAGFTAEDAAVAGDISITALKQRASS